MNIKDLKAGDVIYIKEDVNANDKYGSRSFVNRMLKGIQEIHEVDYDEQTFEIAAEKNEKWFSRFDYTPEMIDWEKTEELIYKVKKIDDKVYNPLHYSGGGKYNIECYEAIEYILGKLENVPDKYYGHVSNIVKYIWRCNYKNGYEDLDKTSVYFDFMFRGEE